MHYYFTWGQFGLTLAAALLIYYLIVAVCCYRRELRDFFTGRLRQPAPQSETRNSYSVMGEVKEDDAEMSLVSSRDLDFAGPEQAAIRDRNKVLLLGSLADFMHELKTLVRITIESEDTKEGFLSLFGLVAGKYGQLMDGSFNESIISYVRDSGLPFQVSANELEQILNDLNDE
ncbi:hypothetical protein [Mucilaginibacter ginsenosidivorans]|uniref:Uncharacterized protein n=1 Tax=Mucilaginibacter ginsenosidivorans TaxID=398053 RepID=A0A5B8UTU3_9SPHI|nr:hypothetical protein [Mucilaginibacter ginsenosidivorans]QEC62444.1 hypothetical protein FRZ54_07535 [Mucilaginibacter ginsenosidivorans]